MEENMNYEEEMQNEEERRVDRPVPPIAPEGGAPVFPGPDANIPVPPIAPEGGQPGIRYFRAGEAIDRGFDTSGYRRHLFPDGSCD